MSELDQHLKPEDLYDKNGASTIWVEFVQEFGETGREHFQWLQKKVWDQKLYPAKTNIPDNNTTRRNTRDRMFRMERTS